MTTTAGSFPHSTARQEAVHWFARVRLGPLSPQDQEQFDHWLSASPEHQRHFQALQQAWNKMDELPVQRLRRLAQEPVRRPTSRVASRRSIFAGLAVMLLLAGVWVWPKGEEQSWTLETAAAQRQELSLPDGSVLTVNARTRLSVVYSIGQRRVQLEAGEILADVQPDAHRPFIVQAAQARVEVLGTRFNVRSHSGLVDVAVDRGRVRLSTGPWWNVRSERLGVGQSARFSPQHGLEPVREADVAAVTAWRSGRLEFDNEPLGQVVERLAAYLDEPVRMGDARAAGMRVSGTLSMDQPEQALALLADIAPVQILNVPTKGWVIGSR